MTTARLSYRLTQAQFEQALEKNPSLELISIQQPSNGQWIVPANDISALDAETAARLIQFNGFVSINKAAFEQAAEAQHVEAEQLIEATARMYAEQFGFSGQWRYNRGHPNRPETVGRSVVFEATSNLANEGTAPIAVLRPVGQAEMAVLVEAPGGDELPPF